MTGPLVLVADDSATSRLVIEKQLKQIGCRVAVADNGETALAAILRERYDIVLLDCFMPDINGDVVARRVREQEGQRDIGYTPLIGISAEADDAHVQMCLTAGMDGILGKPLPLDEFRSMLALWCDYESGDVLKSPAVSAPSAEVQAIDLVALFRTTTLDDLRSMRDALGASDLPGVKRLAHRIKGAALTMGEEAVAQNMERIEAVAMSDAANAGVQIESLLAELATMFESTGHGA